MGMGSSDVRLLLRLHEEGYFHGRRRVVEIGAQQTSDEMLELKEELSYPLSKAFRGAPEAWPLPGPLRQAEKLEGITLQSPNAPPTQHFWEWLGFEYSAIDVDGSPGAIPLDLNYDSVPSDWRSRFSLATNYGTTEHGAYICEGDTAAAGMRAAKNEKHP